MKNRIMNRTAAALLGGVFVLAANSGWAAPKQQNLYAKLVYINPTTGSTASTPGNGRIPMWGFASTPGGLASVPGPKIDVTPSQVADGLIIRVYNLLTNLPTSDPVSLVIPGLNGSTNVGFPVMFSAGDVNYSNRVRSLVQEVVPGGNGYYHWAGPLKVGTYAYHSGSHPALQVQMGLYGMVTVKSNNNTTPYPGYTVAVNHETPVILSEVDSALHWAVHTNGYGPGKAISSTIHCEPDLFMINGRTYSSTAPPPNLAGNGQRNQVTLFRMINFCWNSRIPTLVGPVPLGNITSGGNGGNYLTVIAEDANPYPFARTAYAPNLAALKTMDLLFTPPNPAGPPVPLFFRLYDHRLGLSSAADANGGMYATWLVTN